MMSVVVMGLGFVGAAMTTAIASVRKPDGSPMYDVVGLELPTESGKSRASSINKGIFPFSCGDPNVASALAKSYDMGNVSATTNEAVLSKAAIIIVDIHLDVHIEYGAPKANLNGFCNALETIGRHVNENTLIVIETTVPPGTSEKVVAPLLQTVLAKREMNVESICLAHSYERVMPGPMYLDSITNNWRVYSGLNETSMDRCQEFLSTIINTEHFPLSRLSSMTASETAKALENTFRAVNIALIDEWATFAENAEVDLFEVIKAIRLRPSHKNLMRPGLGVGGYCLTKDLFLGEIAAQQYLPELQMKFEMANLASTINQNMPLRNFQRIKERLGGNLEANRVLLLGVSYRSEVADTRYSAVETLYKQMIADGALVELHDPFVKWWEEVDRKVLNDLPRSKNFDALIFCVPHQKYNAIDLIS